MEQEYHTHVTQQENKYLLFNAYHTHLTHWFFESKRGRKYEHKSTNTANLRKK